MTRVRAYKAGTPKAEVVSTCRKVSEMGCITSKQSYRQMGQHHLRNSSVSKPKKLIRKRSTRRLLSTDVISSVKPLQKPKRARVLSGKHTYGPRRSHPMVPSLANGMSHQLRVMPSTHYIKRSDLVQGNAQSSIANERRSNYSASTRRIQSQVTSADLGIGAGYLAAYDRIGSEEGSLYQTLFWDGEHGDDFVKDDKFYNSTWSFESIDGRYTAKGLDCAGGRRDSCFGGDV